MAGLGLEFVWKSDVADLDIRVRSQHFSDGTVLESIARAIVDKIGHAPDWKYQVFCEGPKDEVALKAYFGVD